MPASSIEHEVKLTVWPGFVLPPLDGVAEGVTAVGRGEKRLEAVYHDTPDMRLARSDITLRHRSDDGWTLKLPDEPVIAGALRRREVTVAGDPRTVPAAIRSLILSRVRTTALGPVARLQTARNRTDLVDADGDVLVEVVDDEVSVIDGRRVALRFREVEVELKNGASPPMLDEIIARLRAAGAGPPDPTPKVMRALGARAQAPPELADRRLGKEPSAGEVLAAGLTRSARGLIEHDPDVRVGTDDEAVHQARVATRRMRSDLRTYADLLDGDWAGALRDELSWLADSLGEVRDADVLLRRLRRQVDELHGAERASGNTLVDVLAAQRHAARARLLADLDSPRYTNLLDQVVEAAADPLTLPAARRPAAETLPRLFVKPWSSLERGARRLVPTSPDEDYHGVRVRAKRARYAADVAALVIGKPAQKLSGELSRLQDILGEHQDACVARQWLRETALDVDAPVAFVAGHLAAMQDAEAAARRTQWPAAWQRASRGKLRAWLKP
jgi:CHAD domain-containing protein